jgi:hypothetical protein
MDLPPVPSEEHQVSNRLMYSLWGGRTASSKVSTLDHELVDDAVEGRALVSEALLASGQSTMPL